MNFWSSRLSSVVRIQDQMVSPDIEKRRLLPFHLFKICKPDPNTRPFKFAIITKLFMASFCASDGHVDAIKNWKPSRMRLCWRKCCLPSSVYKAWWGLTAIILLQKELQKDWWENSTCHLYYRGRDPKMNKVFPFTRGLLPFHQLSLEVEIPACKTVTCQQKQETRVLWT